ncbi:MAG: carboxypeptidase-like regulatory domain-containing protein [Methylococcales bacterium]
MFKKLIKGYEAIYNSAYISILFVFVSIIPAFILFWAFDSSGEIIFKESAYIQTAKFGGAFAGFLITFLILMWQHKKIGEQPAVLAITGTVYDDKGNVLENAEIFIEGDTRSTKSNRNGFFTLEINPNLTEWLLIVSYDGSSEHISVSKNQLNKPVRIKLKKKP